jgi:AAA15 family ATPase/GTPase
MLAGQDDSHQETLVKFENHRVLKSAVVYGANGSGKSNLVKAILFLKRLVLESVSFQPGQLIRYQPHKNSGEKEGSDFSIQFIKNGMRYSYGFRQRVEGIVDEHLFFYPNGRQVKIFTREGDTFHEGDRFKGRFEHCRDILMPNRLMLSCAANFSTITEVQTAFGFFRDDLIVYSGFGEDYWLPFSLGILENDPDKKLKFLHVLQGLCSGIKDIQIEKREIKHHHDVLSENHEEESNKIIVNVAEVRYKTKIQYDTFDIPLQEESSGIQRLVEFLCPFIDVIANERTLVCDELESNFHEAIVKKIVEWFAGAQKSASQLIFTTHDTSILNLDTFRRDQIWFTEMKERERETDLYSLAEIRGVRKEDNVAKGYVSGRYGAIPMLNVDFAEVLQGGRAK